MDESEPPAGDASYRHNDFAVPAARRFSQTARVARVLGIATMIAAVAGGGSCALTMSDQRGPTIVMLTAVTVFVGAVLLVVSTVVEAIARRRLTLHPELSGNHWLAESRRLRRDAAWFIVPATILLGIATWGLMTIDFTQGRPWRHRGRPVRVRSRVRAVGTAARLRGRARLGAVWVWGRAAAAEHASVAAFDDLRRDLAGLGAAPSLLARLRRAALEEVDHTRRCIALTSALTGLHPRPQGPARRPIDHRPVDPARLAVEQFLDGCVGEGHAAAYAGAAEAQTRDREVRAILAVIARDEARHADDAWAVLTWLVDAHRASVVPALEHAASRQPRASTVVPWWLRTSDASAYGVLPRARERALHREVVATAKARLAALLRCEAAD